MTQCPETSVAYFLVGPTASGKTDVAQWIAENEGYAILSADAMLVYRDMDIGTAKPARAQQQRATYGGIDLAVPGETFSVWQYREHACRMLKKWASRGKPVIVCGGTGLYVKSLTHGLDSGPGPSREQRERWENLLAEEGVTALQRELRERSPARYAALDDPANPRRLVRALERALSGDGRAPRSWRVQPDMVPLVGLDLPAEALKSKIAKRVREMYRGGLKEEVRTLVQRYGDLRGTAAQAIGYAEVTDLLAGRCSEEEAVARTVQRTRQLAKRQRTWFRHQADIVWIEADPDYSVEHIAQCVLAKWAELGPTPVAGDVVDGKQ